MKNAKLVVTLALAGILFPLVVRAQVGLDVETGVAFSGYNDVRIPGKGGTLFSLSEELSADPTPFLRIRLSYSLTEKNHLSVLFAPLSFRSEGSIDRDIRFVDQVFPARTPLVASYKFNSYRLTYRHDFLKREKLEFGLGLTAKVRDARIALEGGRLQAEKTNVGFVPILHFRLLWRFHKALGLLLEGDALAAPQGRAEDVLAALTYQVSERVALKTGYRILEGGSDVEQVYTFALIHYVAVGASVFF